MGGPNRWKDDNEKVVHVNLSDEDGMFEMERFIEALVIPPAEGFEVYDETPLDFIGDELDLSFTPDQIRVANSVLNNRLTVVESGHGVGKSVSAAALACWWMAAKDTNDTKCLTFAPTHNQVNNILWRYIRNYGRGADLPGTILDTPRWEFGRRQAERFALGLSPKKSSEDDMAAVQGYHSPRLLIILDECAGLPRIVWQAIDTLQPTRVLAIGNPIIQSGPFWEAANSSRWHRINISCLNHPNMIEGKDIIPGAVTRDWVDGQIDERCEVCEPHSPDGIFIPWRDKWYKPDGRFQARVMGLAPSESPDQLISMAWVEAAKLTNLKPDGEVAISLDPARRGGDAFAIVVKQGAKIHRVELMYAVTNNPTEEVVSWFLGIARECQATRGFIDSGGMGGPILDICRQRADFTVMDVNASHRAPKPKAYHNLRAWCWWHLRKAFQGGEIDLPSLPDSIANKLESDLITPRYKYDNNNRIQIESKDEIKKRLGRSPDAGDALSLHYAMPTQESAGVLAESTLLKVGGGVVTAGAGVGRWGIERSGGRGSRWRK